MVRAPISVSFIVVVSHDCPKRSRCIVVTLVCDLLCSNFALALLFSDIRGYRDIEQHVFDDRIPVEMPRRSVWHEVCGVDVELDPLLACLAEIGIIDTEKRTSEQSPFGQILGLRDVHLLAALILGVRKHEYGEGGRRRFDGICDDLTCRT